MGKPEKIISADPVLHLRLLLEELEGDSYVQQLSGAALCTYTITDKGIAEGKRLSEL